MASFTENPNIAFNPYIQQVPIDDYMKVGIYKQQAYDTNLQKIDEAYSNTAGLDIIQNSQRDYLNNTMNNVKEQLKKYGSADFSNQQLTNSLVGMVNNVTRDPIIQNAVASSATYRKGLADMEDARKKGMSAPENEYYYNNRAQNWLNGNVYSSFNESFTPYTDVQKKAYDIFKSVVGDSFAKDIPFEVDGNGNISSKTAIAMERISQSGVTVDKLKAALRAGLDEKDYNQLRISGIYRFRNFDTNALKAYTDNQYTQKREDAVKTLDALKKQQALNTNNPNYATNLKNSIEYLTNYLAPGGGLEKEYNDHLDFVLNHPEEAKGEIYKNAFIDEFANANSYEHKVMQYVDSPFTKYNEWLTDYNLKKAELESLNNYRKQQLDIEREKLKNEKLAIQLKYEKLYGYGQNLPTSTLPQGINVKGAYDAMVDDINNTQSSINSGIDNLVKTYNKMFPNAKITAKDVTSQIELMQNSQNPTLHFPPNLMPTVQNLVKMKSKLNLIRAGIKKVEDDVNSKMTPEEKENVNYLNNEILKKYKIPSSITVNGKSYSGLDILGVISKMRINPKGTNELTPYEQQVKNAMDNYEYSNELYKTLFSIPAKEISTASTKYYNYSSSVRQRLNETAGENYKNYEPNLTGIVNPSEKSRALYETLLSNVVARTSESKGSDKNFNPKKVSEWLSDDSKRKTIDYKILNQAGQNPRLYIMNGNETYSIELTPQEAQMLPEKLRGNEDMSIRDAFSYTGNNSTNPNGFNPNSAYFTNTNFPRIKNLNVKGDVLAPIDKNDPMVYPVLYWNVPGVGQKHVIAPSPIDWRNANEFFSNIDNNILYQFFLNYGDDETRAALSQKRK
jgi:hypothetical protein